MALIKSIASYVKYIETPLLNEKGEQVAIQRDEVWIPQQDIEMSPEEEAMTRAEWALNEEMQKIPVPPTDKQRLDWMSQGIDFHNTKMAEHEATVNTMKSKVDSLHDEWRRLENVHVSKVEEAKNAIKER